jgi:cysteinyl-tRNA synthetase
MMQANYEKPLNFTFNLLEENKKNLTSLLKQIFTCLVECKVKEKNIDLSEKQDDEFMKILDDDLNFPNAITHIISLIKILSTLLRNSNFDEIQKHISFLLFDLKVLGIKYDFNFNSEVDNLITEYKNAKNSNNYEEADKIRNKLFF